MTFSLTNPSNISITVGDINFDVIMNEFNSVVGRVYVKDTVIPPGAKTFTAQMHLGEGSTNDKAIGQLFSDYLTSAAIPLTIVGTKQSTKIPPLVPALSSVKLASTMTGIAGNLISGIAVSSSLTDLITKKASSEITLKNPLKTDFAITSVKASVTFKPSSGAKPFIVGTIDYNLPSPATVPAGGSMKTDPWPVSVQADIFELLGMLLDPAKYFDVQQNVTVTVGGSGGYKTSMYYYQDHVPFTISVLGLPPIGISPQSLSSMSLPSNLTSITDPAELEKAIIDFLSGKKPSSSSALPSSTVLPSGSGSVTESTATPDSTKPTTTEAGNTPTTTSSTTTTTTTEKPVEKPTEKETDKVTAASATSEEKPEPTENPEPTEIPKFSLPF